MTGVECICVDREHRDAMCAVHGQEAPTKRCDAEGCTKTMRDGVLWRVNPKGVPGIFMCSEHRAFVNDWEQRLNTLEPQADEPRDRAAGVEG